MQPSILGGGNNLLGIHLTKTGDVLGHSSFKQFDILRQIAQMLAHLITRHARHIGAVQAHRARARRPNAQQCPRQAAFAGRAWPNHRQRFARLQGKANPAQHHAIGTRHGQQQVFNAQRTYRHGQRHALLVCGRDGQKITKAPMRRARIHRLLPKRHHLHAGRQGPGQNEGRHNHCTRRDGLFNHQQRAKPQRQHACQCQLQKADHR